MTQKRWHLQTRRTVRRLLPLVLRECTERYRGRSTAYSIPSLRHYPFLLFFFHHCFPLRMASRIFSTSAAGRPSCQWSTFHLHWRRLLSTVDRRRVTDACAASALMEATTLFFLSLLLCGAVRRRLVAARRMRSISVFPMTIPTTTLSMVMPLLLSFSLFFLLFFLCFSLLMIIAQHFRELLYGKFVKMLDTSTKSDFGRKTIVWSCSISHGRASDMRTRCRARDLSRHSVRFLHHFWNRLPHFK